MPKNLDAERLNPCLKEQEMSYHCLDKNGYDQEKCEVYFSNYNTCKKFWGSIVRQRRFQGLYPLLPEPEDRERIKNEALGKINDPIR